MQSFAQTYNPICINRKVLLDAFRYFCSRINKKPGYGLRISSYFYYLWLKIEIIPGKKYGLMTLLILQMFPATMAIPAILSIAYKLPFGMDNIPFLIIVLCGSSDYNIWLMKGFVDGIPKELDESGYVDGASHFTIFIKIILPLSVPMLIVIFFFSFIGTFGEFMISAALLKAPEVKTLMLGLNGMMNSGSTTSWPIYAAASIVSTIPIMIIFISIQKFIAKGLVAGAVKE